MALIKSVLFAIFMCLGALVPVHADISSSRLSNATSKIMLHVSQSADQSGVVTSNARLGPLSYSSKQGFGLTVATSDISARFPYRITPLALPANTSVGEGQTRANAHFSAQKPLVTAALSATLRQEGAASGWFAYEQVLELSIISTVTRTVPPDATLTLNPDGQYSNCSRDGDCAPVVISPDTGERTETVTIYTPTRRTLTWFVFVDSASAGIAANPKLIDTAPLILDMTVFPSNSEVNLSAWSSGLPRGVIRYRMSDSSTGNPVSQYTDIPIGSVFDLANPDNTPDSLMPCIIDSSKVGCLSALMDVKKLMSKTGSSAVVLRYIAPPTIVYDLASETPNEDGTYNYRERMTLGITRRTLDYATSCASPVHTNEGNYNVTLQSSVYQYGVSADFNFSNLSANPFTFAAFGGSGKTFTLVESVPAAEEANLAGKVLNPLRPTEYIQVASTPNLTAVSLSVLNKKEFCEKPCSAPGGTYTVGTTSCTIGPINILHQGQATLVNTRVDHVGSVSYSCRNGTLTQLSGTCEYIAPKKDCTSTTLSWNASSGGGICTASAPATLHNAPVTLTDNSSLSSADGLGTASFICDDGAFKPQSSSSCNVTFIEPPPPPPAGDTRVDNPTTDLTPPPTTSPDGGGTVIQPPPVVVTPSPPAPAVEPTVEGGTNTTAGDGLYFVTSAVRSGTTGSYTYFVRSYRRQSNGTYALASTVPMGEINGAKNNVSKSSPALFSHWGAGLAYFDGLLVVGTPNYNPPSVISNAYNQDGVGRLDFFTVNQSTGALTLTRTYTGTGGSTQFQVGRNLTITKSAVITNSDDKRTTAVRHSFLLFSRVNLGSTIPTTSTAITGTLPRIVRAGNSSFAAAYEVGGSSSVTHHVAVYQITGSGLSVSLQVPSSTQNYSTPNSGATTMVNSGSSNIRVNVPKIDGIYVSQSYYTSLVLKGTTRSAVNGEMVTVYLPLTLTGGSGGTTGTIGSFGPSAWKYFGPNAAHFQVAPPPNPLLPGTETLVGIGTSSEGTSFSASEAGNGGTTGFVAPTLITTSQLSGAYIKTVNLTTSTAAPTFKSFSFFANYSMVPIAANSNVFAPPPFAVDAHQSIGLLQPTFSNVFTLPPIGRITPNLSIKTQATAITSGF